MKKTVQPRCTATLDAYGIISRAVDEGVSYGLRRAHKHVENPDEEHIATCVYDAVMLELCNVVKFSDGEEA